MYPQMWLLEEEKKKLYDELQAEMRVALSRVARAASGFTEPDEDDDVEAAKGVAEAIQAKMNSLGSRYYLKAMNCPHHHKLFAAVPRSYRDLPLRLAEYGKG